MPPTAAARAPDAGSRNPDAVERVRCPVLGYAALVKRVEKKLFAVADRLEALARERAHVVAELDELREIAVESQSDAMYYDEAIDRVDARLTAGDVARFERLLARLDHERTQLEAKRAKLLDKL